MEEMSFLRWGSFLLFWIIFCLIWYLIHNYQIRKLKRKTIEAHNTEHNVGDVFIRSTKSPGNPFESEQNAKYRITEKKKDKVHDYKVWYKMQEISSTPFDFDVSSFHFDEIYKKEEK